MTPTRPTSSGGFTLAEVMLAAAMLTVAIVALLGAFIGQNMLNEHARNLTWAINDASRVIERLRELNTGAACAAPDARAPGAYATWDAWLADAANGGGGKSIQPNPASNERIFVTCRDNNAPNAACGTTDQVRAGEWVSQGIDTNFDPIQITVAVCWRHGQRTIGECTWNAGTQTLNANDADGDGVIESPGMLSTVMTCRR